MSLQTYDSSPVTRCALCGRAASGPCARCRRSVCADCCVLTEGASTFALCLGCARTSTSLARPWLSLLLWLAGLTLALAAVCLVLAVLLR